MDEKRFDELVKQLGTTRLTRVSMIRGLAAGAVAALTGAAVSSGHTVAAPDKPCGVAGDKCEGSSQTCCAGFICDPRGGPATVCVACGDEGDVCCAQGGCLDPFECIGGECVIPPGQCGGTGELCCQPNDTCIGQRICINGECELCGTIGERCCAGEVCNQGRCQGGICVANPGPTTSAVGACPPGQARSNTGACFTFGLSCKTNEPAMECCIRSVKKGCARKQSTAHAKKNCLKRGKKRCKKLLAGV